MSRKPFVLGLTGSIGMGKSTTAGFFRNKGVPVWDADAAVHRLYAPQGLAVSGIASICPDAVSDSGVDRAKLRDWIAKDETAIKKLEQVVHPLVAEDRRSFIVQCGKDGHDLVIVDVPLLFETGGNASVDATLVVSAPPDLQKARVLERPGMTEDHFARILASQMPDAEKRKRADFVIETISLEVAQHAAEKVLQDLRIRIADHA